MIRNGVVNNLGIRYEVSVYFFMVRLQWFLLNVIYRGLANTLLINTLKLLHIYIVESVSNLTVFFNLNLRYTVSKGDRILSRATLFRSIDRDS